MELLQSGGDQLSKRRSVAVQITRTNFKTRDLTNECDFGGTSRKSEALLRCKHIYDVKTYNIVVLMGFKISYLKEEIIRAD